MCQLKIFEGIWEIQEQSDKDNSVLKTRKSQGVVSTPGEANIGNYLNLISLDHIH